MDSRVGLSMGGLHGLGKEERFSLVLSSNV